MDKNERGEHDAGAPMNVEQFKFDAEGRPGRRGHERSAALNAFGRFRTERRVL
jgi:hypothetical protein